MNPKKLRMKIYGMTCDHCEATVMRALESAGAREAKADFRREEAVFTVEGEVDEAKLAAAVRDAGYRPGAIETVEPQVPIVASRDGYDLAILGSGSAAFAAAIRARDLGARVVMVERGTIGGTCVNVGCVPSKALLRAAEVYYQAGHHHFAGIETKAGRVDLRTLVAQKDGLVSTLRHEKYEELVEVYGWEVLRGQARFVDPETLLVDGQLLKASSYLIATGASPAVPPIEGLMEAGYLTSTTALDLTQLPRSLAVIGANAIGLEMGQLFHMLGTKVTLIEILPRIAPFEEPEISAALRGLLEEEGLEVLTGAQLQRVEKTVAGKRLHVAVDGGVREITVDDMLVATGRRPNTVDLALDRAGVETDKRGAVAVDENLRSSNPRVFAAGDVTPHPQFVYVAAYTGSLAAENALNGEAKAIDLSALPRVTFTSPQIAAVGLTEDEARQAEHEVKVSMLSLDAVPRALVNRETRGLFKLVVDAQTDRILGVHMLAEAAGEVVYAGTLAVKFKLTLADLLGSFAPYLTMAEGMKLAAQTFSRDVAKLSCCAG